MATPAPRPRRRPRSTAGAAGPRRRSSSGPVHTTSPAQGTGGVPGGAQPGPLPCRPAPAVISLIFGFPLGPVPELSKPAPRRCLWGRDTRGCPEERIWDPPATPASPRPCREPRAFREGFHASRRFGIAAQGTATPAPPAPSPRAAPGARGSAQAGDPCPGRGSVSARARSSPCLAEPLPRRGAQPVPSSGPRSPAPAPPTAPHCCGASQGPFLPSPSPSPPGSAANIPNFSRCRLGTRSAHGAQHPAARQGCLASSLPRTGDETGSSPQFSSSAKMHSTGGEGWGLGPIFSKTSPFNALYLPPLVPKQPTPFPPLSTSLNNLFWLIKFN